MKVNGVRSIALQHSSPDSIPRAPQGWEEKVPLQRQALADPSLPPAFCPHGLVTLRPQHVQTKLPPSTTCLG